MTGLFDADTYRDTHGAGTARFLVTLGTTVEVVTAVDAETARAQVVARRFPTRGQGAMAARVLPPDTTEIRVREVTAEELAAYGIE